MKLDIYNRSGDKSGKTLDANDGVFGVEPNEHVVYLAVKQYLAAQRQGTHKSKERGEIAGSTRKIKRQKGTGTARAGSIKSGVFRGGGRIFGPRPRNYSIRLNKKVSVLARKSALSSKMNAGAITIVEDFSFDAPKTKDFNTLLKGFDSIDKKTLVISSSYDKNLYLSGRNVPRTNVLPARDINVYSLLNADRILMTESAVKEIENVLA